MATVNWVLVEQGNCLSVFFVFVVIGAILNFALAPEEVYQPGDITADNCATGVDISRAIEPFKQASRIR